MKIQLDKITHFFASYVMADVLYKILLLLPAFDAENLLFPAIFALLIGFLKEFYDGIKNNNFDYYDLLADFAGVGFWFIINK